VTHPSRERFAAAVTAPRPDLALACLLIGAEVDPGLDPEPWLDRLDALAAEVVLPADGAGAADHAEALGRVLGDAAGHGFAGSGADYRDLRSSLLHEVLRRRRGLPILLSVLWVEVARRAGVPAYRVGLPGHFVAGVGDPDGDHQLVDPFSGGRPVSDARLTALGRAAGLPATADLLRGWDEVETLHRVLTNVRVWAAARPERLPTRLWATELALLLPRRPIALHREHGELLVRRGDFVGGAAELDAYADVVAAVDPEAADAARTGARVARARLN